MWDPIYNYIEEQLGAHVIDKETRDDFFKRKFYPKYKTEGYQVYWINTAKHKSLEEGYIGVSPLCNNALSRRYNIEMWYYKKFGDKNIGRKYLLENLLNNFAKLQYNTLYSGLSKDKANAYERFLRPYNNYKGDRDENNWNTKKGGG